ncbi:MAG: hypothetical protein IPI42_08695 [Saprospiraceae bacterium]|nr:hypothetical protein [Candidatus Parvibacillus calidus]
MADCKTLEHVIDELRVVRADKHQAQQWCWMQASPRKRIFAYWSRRAINTFV